MNFVSASFFLFFIAMFLVRSTIGRRKNETAYIGTLIVASLVFYAWHIPRHLWIILLSTCVDYVAGHLLGTQRAPFRRKLILIVSLTVNLGLLFFFKYTNFVLGELGTLFGALGSKTSLPTLDLILPMGISFYTFQSMSYTIDVYRRQLEPYESFPKFLLFVSFFPQLMAGPIVRAREFLYQIDRRRRLSAPVLLEGVYLTVRGFFLKMVCADNLGAIIDHNWEAASAPGAGTPLAMTIALLCGFRIFCDFAGYSSIARGLAYMLGFRLPVNFNSPFLSCSFREFWARWHMTLGHWLRDYVYISLRGGHAGKMLMLRNLFIVMFVGGLWHGATVPMILWGSLHGLFLVVERALGLSDPRGTLSRLLGWAVTQTGTFFLWLFFFSPDTTELWSIVGNALSLASGGLAEIPLATAALLCLPGLTIHARRFLHERFEVSEPGPRERAGLAGLMLYGIVTCFGVNDAFIYFQF